MTVPSDHSSSGSSANWLLKNKEHRKTSAASNMSCMHPYTTWFIYFYIFILYAKFLLPSILTGYDITVGC